MNQPRTPVSLPHKYRLCGLGYAKAKAVRLGIKHRTKDGYLYTETPL